MFPIKKNYTKNIVDEKGNKIARIEYEQATVYDWYKFVYSKNQASELYHFIESNIQYDKGLTARQKNKILESILTIDIIKEFTDTRYKVHKSIYGGGGGREAIEQANIVFVCKELGISPHDLIHNYTMEEYQYYLDGIIFNSYEGTKEGQAKNTALVAKNSVNYKAKVKKIKEEGDFLDSIM